MGADPHAGILPGLVPAEALALLDDEVDVMVHGRPSVPFGVEPRVLVALVVLDGEVGVAVAPVVVGVLGLTGPTGVVVGVVAGDVLFVDGTTGVVLGVVGAEVLVTGAVLVVDVLVDVLGADGVVDVGVLVLDGVDGVVLVDVEVVLLGGVVGDVLVDVGVGVGVVLGVVGADVLVTGAGEVVAGGVVGAVVTGVVVLLGGVTGVVALSCPVPEPPLAYERTVVSLVLGAPFTNTVAVSVHGPSPVNCMSSPTRTNSFGTDVLSRTLLSLCVYVTGIAFPETQVPSLKEPGESHEVTQL